MPAEDAQIEVARLSRDVDEAMAEILSTSTMTLATADSERGPHATPVFFAADERLRLFFLSDPETRHAQDIAAGGPAAAGIYPDEPDWRRLRGVQLSGRVHELDTGPEHDEAWRVYAAKFPVVEQLPDAVARSRLYVLEPDWVRLIDNRRGFAFRREWKLVAPAG